MVLWVLFEIIGFTSQHYSELLSLGNIIHKQSGLLNFMFP